MTENSDNNNIDEYLAKILKEAGSTKPAQPSENNLLTPEDEAQMQTLLKLIRDGSRAILIVEDGNNLKYIFSNATPVEALVILGKVIEATGRSFLTDK
jgi:hypothetical protein